MKKHTLIFFSIVPFMAISQNVYTVPFDIRASFKENNCIEVKDYYLDAEVLEKPYLYGIYSILNNFNDKNDTSFIAWCRQKSDRKFGSFLIIINPKDLKWPGGCSFPITNLDFAGGLSVDRKNKVIKSEKDGLITEMFCQNKNWVVRSID